MTTVVMVLGVWATTSHLSSRSAIAVAPLAQSSVEGSYASTSEIRHVMKSNGIECKEWTTASTGTRDVLERAYCDTSMVISIYTDSVEAMESVEAIRNSPTRRVPNFVVGSNWSINCGSGVELCGRLQLALGGRMELSR